MLISTEWDLFITLLYFSLTKDVGETENKERNGGLFVLCKFRYRPGITLGVAFVLGGLLNPQEAFALNDGSNALGQQRSCC